MMKVHHTEVVMNYVLIGYIAVVILVLVLFGAISLLPTKKQGTSDPLYHMPKIPSKGDEP